MRGIVLNGELPFGKDAAYELLKGQTYNWRRLLLALGLRLFVIFNRLTSDERESVLIIDDSPYDRSRSKWVNLLARVWDHSTGRFLKGFRMLTICWSDGTRKDWLALLSTDTELADEDIVRIYGKRLDIEVFIKMAKQHLKLAKEIQCCDFDALIAHATIVFMRYMFLAYQCRMEKDQSHLWRLVLRLLR